MSLSRLSASMGLLKKYLQLPCFLKDKLYMLLVLSKYLIYKKVLMRDITIFDLIKRRVLFSVSGYKWIFDPRNVDYTRLPIELHEDFLTSLMSELCKGRVFIDIGASVGLWIVKLSPFYRRSIAVEPNTMNLFNFLENLVLNNIDDKVRVIQAFAGSEMSLDYLVNSFIREDEQIFIKIDVEGMEFSVLKSGQDMLLEKDVILLIECHGEENFRRVKEYLRDNGYEIRILHTVHNDPTFGKLIYIHAYK